MMELECDQCNNCSVSARLKMLHNDVGIVPVLPVNKDQYNVPLQLELKYDYSLQAVVLVSVSSAPQKLKTKLSEGQWVIKSIGGRPADHSYATALKEQQSFVLWGPTMTFLSDDVLRKQMVLCFR